MKVRIKSRRSPWQMAVRQQQQQQQPPTGTARDATDTLDEHPQKTQRPLPRKPEPEPEFEPGDINEEQISQEHTNTPTHKQQQSCRGACLAVYNGSNSTRTSSSLFRSKSELDSKDLRLVSSTPPPRNRAPGQAATPIGLLPFLTDARIPPRRRFWSMVFFRLCGFVASPRSPGFESSDVSLDTRRGGRGTGDDVGPLAEISRLSDWD